MELYKLDYNFKVIKLNIIKETPKTVIYSYPGGVVGNTIRKVELDSIRNNDTSSVIATSIESLLSILEKMIQTDIEYHNGRIDVNKRNIDIIRKSIDNYKNSTEDDTETE